MEREVHKHWYILTNENLKIVLQQEDGDNVPHGALINYIIELI